MTCYCSNVYQKVEQQGKKMWSFYRYNLTIEYNEKPLLPPPLIIINILWRAIIYRCRSTKIHPSDNS